MKLLSRKGIAALVAAASALGIGAAAQAEDVITLGASVQMTGGHANTGRYYKDAYQLAVDKINAAGGVTVGGKTYMLKLDLLDNQSDVNLSVRQYVQLVSADKVNFLLGPFASNFVISDSAVSEKYEIPMVEGGGSSGQIFSRGYKYVFGTLPPAGAYYASTIKMMGELKPTVKTVALVSADDSFDVSVAKGTRKLLDAAGLKIAVDEQYAENSSDFLSILTKIKAANVDAILWSGHEPEALNFIRQMKQLNVNPADMTAFTVGVPTADFRKALGADANYSFGMTTWLPSPALKDKWFGDAAEFAKEYQAKYGYAPDYHAASGAADVETYVYALEKAGSLDPKAVRDAIAASDFQSLYANVKYGANGQIDLPQIVVQVQNGDLKAVYTTQFIDKPQYPVPAWDKR